MAISDRFTPVRHATRDPDVPGLLDVLHRRGLRYVLVGSAAAAAHGVELRPADLDVVPDTEEMNLRRLVEVLRELEAMPLGPFGGWTEIGNGEKKWIPRPTTEEELTGWMPDVQDISSFDHAYVTRLGNLDVVPEIAGSYEVLLRRASSRTWNGFEVRLAHVDDLLARLTVPRREKDGPRVAALREIQRGSES